MINSEKWAWIKELRLQGYGLRSISKIVGVSRNTVRKALVKVEPPKYIRRKLVGSKLDPYKEKIEYMYFKQGQPGTIIYLKIREEGYNGSLSILHRYLRKQKKIKEQEISKIDK